MLKIIIQAGGVRFQSANVKQSGTANASGGTNRFKVTTISKIMTVQVKIIYLIIQTRIDY